MEYQSCGWEGTRRRSAAARTSATARIWSTWRETFGSDLEILLADTWHAAKLRHLRRDRQGRRTESSDPSWVPLLLLMLSVSRFIFFFFGYSEKGKWKDYVAESDGFIFWFLGKVPQFEILMVGMLLL